MLRSSSQEKRTIASIPSFEIFLAKMLMKIDSSSSSGSNCSRLKKMLLTSLYVWLGEGMIPLAVVPTVKLEH